MRTALLVSVLIAAPSALVPTAGPFDAPGSVDAVARPDTSLTQDQEAKTADDSGDRNRGDKDKDDKSKRPALSLRASPPIAFSPANVHLVAELKGGPDDYEDFYCPAVEWDWGDGTRSEASADCDPYEAGVSQITRRFSKTHTYNLQGRYRVQVRLKRNSKLLTSASTNIQVRGGLRDAPYY